MPGTADPLPAPAYCKRGRTFEAPSLFNMASCAGVSGIPTSMNRIGRRTIICMRVIVAPAVRLYVVGNG